MVAPLIAALEAAMRVKSFPVMPSNTSLRRKQCQYCILELYWACSYMLTVFCDVDRAVFGLNLLL